MNRSETAMLLGMAAARDRRTVGESDVAAWANDLNDIDFADARAAVDRHFRESTDWLMPAHVRRLVKLIRDERRPHHEILALPSRFEDDDERVQRVRRGIEKCAQALSLTRRTETAVAEPGEELSPSDVIRNRALDRARRERKANV